MPHLQQILLADRRHHQYKTCHGLSRHPRPRRLELRFDFHPSVWILPLVPCKCAATNKHADRLPTVSAAQALEDISTDPRRFISTSIRALDNALVSVRTDDGDASSGLGGFQRGQVAEIWGPPGSGKTAFG